MISPHFAGRFSNIPVNPTAEKRSRTITPDTLQAIVNELTEAHGVEATIDYFQRDTHVVSSFGEEHTFPVLPAKNDQNRSATVSFSSVSPNRMDQVDQAFAQALAPDYQYGDWSTGQGNSPDFKVTYKLAHGIHEEGHQSLRAWLQTTLNTLTSGLL